MLGMEKKELEWLLEKELASVISLGEAILQTDEVLRKANHLITKAIVANNAKIEESLKKR